ncbi:hypothetical protein BCR42DRAFT_188831 [Absidia repens]|uniref:Uncharacterized protein n=1 Tax=Absidia repens TaxID=90262 RepID=A0A1X2IRP5_9FUNG|nr:hypothetical protein BCR42DRAFT_188831 [Absidia repens]
MMNKGDNKEKGKAGRIKKLKGMYSRIPLTKPKVVNKTPKNDYFFSAFVFLFVFSGFSTAIPMISSTRHQTSHHNHWFSGQSRD